MINYVVERRELLLARLDAFDGALFRPDHAGNVIADGVGGCSLDVTDERADLIGWESSEQMRVVGAKGEHEEFNPFELEFGDDGFTGLLAQLRR